MYSLILMLLCNEARLGFPFGPIIRLNIPLAIIDRAMYGFVSGGG
jgi:hypothetical protein